MDHHGSLKGPASDKSMNPFVQIFHFTPDSSRIGRVLSSVRIGDVYMSRLTIEPGVITGNFFHLETSIMFYVEAGLIVAGFEHIETKERKEVEIKPGMQVVHVPPQVARSFKNIGSEEAVVVFFSNRALRSEDDSYPYQIF